MINKTSPISFNGLKIEGVVSLNNMEKLGKFATAAENTRFINDLEKTFNTHMVVNGSLDEVSFSHELYGNLTKFGCPKFSAAEFYSKVVDAMEGIKLAIKKAEKDYREFKQNCEDTHRGC